MDQYRAQRSIVLLVDDDQDFRAAIERALRTRGLDVHAFSSAAELQASEDLSRAVCLVLDIHLGGTSGIELRNQLSKSGYTIPVVFITGKDSEGTQSAARAAGCLAYLQKPFAIRSLVDAIGEAQRQQHISG